MPAQREPARIGFLAGEPHPLLPSAAPKMSAARKFPRSERVLVTQFPTLVGHPIPHGEDCAPSSGGLCSRFTLASGRLVHGTGAVIGSRRFGRAGADRVVCALKGRRVDAADREVNCFRLSDTRSRGIGQHPWVMLGAAVDHAAGVLGGALAASVGLVPGGPTGPYLTESSAAQARSGLLHDIGRGGWG